MVDIIAEKPKKQTKPKNTQRSVYFLGNADFWYRCAPGHCIKGFVFREKVQRIGVCLPEVTITTFPRHIDVCKWLSQILPHLNFTGQLF